MKKLLIHHHEIAYSDSNGIWVRAYFGHWVSELAKYFSVIGLLLNESPKKLPSQDTCISMKNVVLESLYTQSKTSNRIKRRKYIINKCREMSHYDILLIRGMTPKQYTVFKHCNIDKTAFLLIQSLFPPIPSLFFNKVAVIEFLFWKLRKFQYKLISKHSLLLANSPSLCNEIRRYTGYDAQFVSTNIISENDIKLWPPKKEKLTNDVNLLFGGRIVEEKGILELVEAVGILNKSTNYKYHLHIVGKFITDSFKNNVAKLIDSLNVYKNITFHGYIPYGHELLNVYQITDIVILPSYHEGFSRLIWEAFLLKRPVITTDVGGISGFLTNGKEALLIAPKEANQIVDAVLKLLSDHALVSHLVDNGFNMVLEYTLEKCAIRLSHIIYQYA